VWTRFNDLLAESFAVTAVDLPGYAQSARPEDARSPRDLAIYISQLIDVMGLDGVHVVGAGLGGWVAAELATMNQRPLASLTLIGAAGVKPREGFIHDPMLASYIDYMKVSFHDPDKLEELFGSAPDQSVVDLWDYSREMTARLTWKQWMWNLTLPSLLPGIHIPTLVVWGADDRVVPIDCAQQYAELIPGARLVTIEDAGHVVELEQADSVAKLIVEAINL
jgi:pimeloyl-ACP methyl ester carboxylesterase